MEASKGGMKVGRIKDPLYKDSYYGITPPNFIPPFEAPDSRVHFNEMRALAVQGLGVWGVRG